MRLRVARAAVILVLAAAAGVAIVDLTQPAASKRPRLAAAAMGRGGASDGRPASGAPGANRGSGGPERHVSPSGKPRAAAVLNASSAASFASLETSLPGHLELAVAPLGGGRIETMGGDHPAHGWSTTKVPVLVSLLLMRGSRGLVARERSLAESAIAESNNEAVQALFAELEEAEGGLIGASRYVESVMRLGGDAATTVATAPPPPGAITTFGQTEWSPAASVRFFRSLALGCLLPAAATHYVLRLMQSIEPSESWGLGSAGFARVAFKGGWGPEAGGYLVRQTGVIDPGDSRGLAVAIVATAPSFAGGTEMLTRTALWLRQHLVLVSRPARGCPLGAR